MSESDMCEIVVLIFFLSFLLVVVVFCLLLSLAFVQEALLRDTFCRNMVALGGAKVECSNQPTARRHEQPLGC